MYIKKIVNLFCVTSFFLCLTETFGQNQETGLRPRTDEHSTITPRVVFPQDISIYSSTAAVVLDSSNLPIVVINTNGQTISDEPKIIAQMKVINNEPPRKNYVTDPGNIYYGFVGIEIRGSYSASLPQKPYGFETRDSLGNNLNVPILDMPAENDWILTANYNDKTFMRATLAFDLFSKMGHYQPRTRLCEVTVNNDYKGIYVLTEKIKQNKNRISIAKLTAADTIGDDLTGGYIIKIDNSNFDGSDGWYSKYQAIDRTRYPYFVYSYPKPEDILNQQKQYIQGFVNKIDSVLRSPKWADPQDGYRKYFDVSSFIDVFILGEVSRNVDTYKKSAFFYKDKDSTDGRLHAGPVWDFDWAWKNMRGECNSEEIDGSGWTYKISSDCHTNPVPPGWVVKLLEDTTFANELHTRYSLLRKTILSEESLYHYIDSIHTLVNEAQTRHYQKWPILGINVGAPEVDPEPSTYDSVLTKFKNWIATRLTWLDANMPGRDTQVSHVLGMGTMPKEFILFQNYPNPFNPSTKIIYTLKSSGKVRLSVYDLLGREVVVPVNNERKIAGKYEVSFDAANLPSGVYFYRLSVVLSARRDFVPTDGRDGQAENSVETKSMVLIK
jgi:hypothetical protein